MSENTTNDNDSSNEETTTLGAVDGPRAHFLTYIERQTTAKEGTLDADLPRLTESNFVDVLDVDMNQVDIYVDALVYLLSTGAIHSQKGKGGGLKLGAKPERTKQSIVAQMLAAKKREAGLIKPQAK